MTTLRQHEANRRNARRPKAGALHAPPTRIHSTPKLLTAEHRDDYHALIAEYYGRFFPTSVSERELLDELICTEWTLRTGVRPPEHTPGQSDAA